MTTRIITSNDIDLQTLEIHENKLRVNVANVVPAAKADRFLKNVAANEDNTKIVFTVSPETDGGEDTKFELPVASFLTGLATSEDLDTAKGRTSIVEGRVAALEEQVAALEQKSEANALTADNLTTLLTDPAAKEALIAAIRGEEVAGLDGVAKGFLITNA